MGNKYREILAKLNLPVDFYRTNAFVFGLWLVVAITFVIQSLVTHRYNNYLIFENTFRNLIHRQSLYAAYPAYHEDANHYGPLFSLFIAPFAILNNAVGLFFWNLFNCIVLFKAVLSLPFSDRDKLTIGYIAIPCLVASMLNQQFNASAGAFIILSYTLLNKDKGIWSAMLIVVGTFIKLYGIMGLAFFFFVKDKPRFVLWLMVWTALFFALPMLFSSPEYVLHSYREWMQSLVNKNVCNITGNGSTDVSIMGFFRSLLHQNISNMTFIGLGALIFLLPYTRFSLYGHKNFQLLILASALLFPVLFSTGSEDCTYIIAIPGVGIWFLLEGDRRLKTYLLPVVMVFACNFPLLFFPAFSHRFPIISAMLSVPFFLVWLRIIYNATRAANPVI